MSAVPTQRTRNRAAALFVILATLSPGCAAPEPAAPVPPLEQAHPETYLHALCAEMRNTWPGNRTINIVCHGHSVPAGYFQTPVVDSFNAYPSLLHQGLKERFPHAVINVIVTAIGGETSVSGSARFEADVLTHRPDLITIDYALNDRRAGLEASRASLEAMLEDARIAGVPVLLLTPTLDLRSDFADAADPLNLHAVQVRELAQTHGVGLVDSFSAFRAEIASGVSANDLMSSANHPNRAGHELVAEALLEWFPSDG